MSIEEHLYEIVAKTQISDLLIRYFRALDDKQLDKTIVVATFAADVRVIRHNGNVAIGHDDILDTHLKGFAGIKAMHHAITGFVIDIDKDKAVINANLTITHLLAAKGENTSIEEKAFYGGGVLLTKAVKNDNH